MTRVLALAVATFLLFSFAALAYPGKHHGKHGKRDWWTKTEVVEQLNLTEQQKSQIDEIAAANKERIDTLRAQAKTDFQGLREVMKDPNATREQIIAKFDQLGKTHGELGRAQFEMKLDIREVLSVDQRTKLYEIKEQKMKGHRGDKTDA